jgi:hypothetical protein
MAIRGASINALLYREMGHLMGRLFSSEFDIPFVGISGTIAMTVGTDYTIGMIQP